MSDILAPSSEDVDGHVDREIYDCLSLEHPKSFFLYAGAGSGKTRSLVNALDYLRREHGHDLWLRRQRVAVVTYTNAACDEIRSRLAFDRLFEVSTIHSFAWLLIEGYNQDIREWLRTNLQAEISELTVQQAKGRRTSQAFVDRARSIESKNNRLATLSAIKKFVYNPTGDNRGRDALNHSEVISIAVSFLNEKRGLRSILVTKFPILLIDESQDTNKHLMEALLNIQSASEGKFCLGLFGDTMQRIYADGKVDLGENLPAAWARPAKRMNHRSRVRIIELINKIRSSVDNQRQLARADRSGGVVRLFVAPSSTRDKSSLEGRAAARMSTVTGNPNWLNARTEVKTLILEHHMAARRMGFLDMFQALYPIEQTRTGLLDGTLPGVSLFARQVWPLVRSMRAGDRFEAAAVVRKYSPLLDSAILKAAGIDQPKVLNRAKQAADDLMAICNRNSRATFSEILDSVVQTGLFEVPEALRTIASRKDEAAREIQGPEEGDSDESLAAWSRFLETPFDQIEPYAAYVAGRAEFDTHQGVKGREFSQVMVIIDDEEARGFLFSYDKLFGTKEKSKTDMEHERKGEETSVDRTRRLFYVTCSRAKESLAIIAYSGDPGSVRATAIAQGWFKPEETELIDETYTGSRLN